MNDNINPEVNAEEDIALEEENVVSAEENVVSAEEKIAPEEEVASDDTDSDDTESAVEEKVAPVKKKKKMIQLPVIISLCIVLVALIGYFVYAAFFLREPDGKLFWSDPIIWQETVELENGDEVTCYYQFDTDSTFRAYVGSVEYTGTYEKSTNEDGEKTLIVSTSAGDFYGGYPATYTISGSRILGNQSIKITYSEDFSFEAKQAKEIENPLELPEDFKANDKLVGTWNFDMYGNKMQLIINDNGTMSLESIAGANKSTKINGVYTYDDENINFTYCEVKEQVIPLPYQLDGDYLTFMGYIFTREGSGAEPATPDQQLMLQ